MMDPGRIVLVDFPQANGALKARPVLILRSLPPFGDLLICGVTSQRHHFDSAIDVLLDERHGDYKISGLRVPSLIRSTKLAMIESDDARVRGAIGRISPSTLSGIQERLARLIHPRL